MPDGFESAMKEFFDDLAHLQKLATYKFPKKVLCLRCGKSHRYFIGVRKSFVKYKQTKVEYDEMIGFCKKCGREVDVPTLWDRNLLRIKGAYIDKQCETEQEAKR